MSTIKNLSIVSTLGDKTSKHIGAEAENIDVSRNSSGQIDTVNHQSTTESLKVTLSGIEDRLDNVNTNFIGTLAQWNALTDTQKERYDTVDITDDFNGVPIDNSLSTISENPVQNKVIRNIIGDLTQLSTTTKTDLVSAINEAAGSGGSGGHTILNDSGTSLTQRQNLQFKGVSVTDDSTNERTVVEVADIDKNFRGTLAQWNALTTEQKKEYDTYDIIDDFNELGIDSVLSTSSENPVQNKVITTGINTLTTNLNNEAQKISGNGDVYSTSKTYKVGDFCIYDNKVYKCITACSAGSWSVNQSCFEQDTLTNAITFANTQISNLTSQIGSFQYYYQRTTESKYDSWEGQLDAFFEYAPRNVLLIGTLNFSGRNPFIGYLYDDNMYGCVLCARTFGDIRILYRDGSTTSKVKTLL